VSKRDQGLTDFLRATFAQLGSLRDAVSRSSDFGRARLDVTLARRERSRLLQLLGERFLQEIASGEVAPPEDVHELVARVAEIDGEIGERAQRASEAEVRAYRAAADVLSSERASARGDARAAATTAPPNVSPDLTEEDPDAESTIRSTARRDRGIKRDQ
jgi:hypothetical protein